MHSAYSSTRRFHRCISVINDPCVGSYLSVNRTCLAGRGVPSVVSALNAALTKLRIRSITVSGSLRAFPFFTSVGG